MQEVRRWGTDLAGVGLAVHCVLGALVAGRTPVSVELLQLVRGLQRSSAQLCNITQPLYLLIYNPHSSTHSFNAVCYFIWVANVSLLSPSLKVWPVQKELIDRIREQPHTEHKVNGTDKKYRVGRGLNLCIHVRRQWAADPGLSWGGGGRYMIKVGGSPGGFGAIEYSPRGKEGSKISTPENLLNISAKLWVLKRTYIK